MQKYTRMMKVRQNFGNVFCLSQFSTSNRKETERFVLGDRIKDMENIIKTKNKEIEDDRELLKDHKPYMNKISQQRIDNIGSKSLLDKQWNERPTRVI